MKIILLKDVPKVGRKYDTKEVSEGYAANLLIPRGLAVAATPSAVKAIAVEKSKIEGEKKVHEELLAKNLEALDGKTITIKEKLNEKGHLFAAIHKPEVMAAIESQVRVQINPENLIMEKPLKEGGDHVLEAKGSGKCIKFTLSIKSK